MLKKDSLVCSYLSFLLNYIYLVLENIKRNLQSKLENKKKPHNKVNEKKQQQKKTQIYYIELSRKNRVSNKASI